MFSSDDSPFMPIIAERAIAHLGDQMSVGDDFIVSPVDDVVDAYREAFNNDVGITVGERRSWKRKHAYLNHPSDRRMVIVRDMQIKPTVLMPAEETILQAAKIVGWVEVPTLRAPEVKSRFVQGKRKSQLALDLPTKFVPSKELAEFWVRGVDAISKGIRGGAIAPVSDPEIRAEFSRMMSALFGTTAQQLRYEGHFAATITKKQRFDVLYQIQLCEQFLIIPDESQRFLDLLFRELRNSVSTGSIISGSWGKMFVNREGDLELELLPPAEIVDSAFVTAEDVE
jgi:hypothetical protein